MGRISCRLKSAERSMLTEDDGFGVDSVCESLIRYQQRLDSVSTKEDWFESPREREIADTERR
ncbi:hypothetical protein Bca52824_032349 [Brassica carinata]|uniref:Uncharacterized protein n=1 Tax=Brassica carinata TaxID=52824 RepID=A0A8X7SA05_BRACI|nr:hypothetical protein Bca52824_032349 [Brassica carinata]